MVATATSSTLPSRPKPTTIMEALKTLEILRTRHVHASEQVLENADFLFANNVDLQKRLGDEYWPFLEQLARASLDLGRAELAEDSIMRLEDRFPNSPRVQVLHGMQKEAAGKLADALRVYNAILEVEDANPVSATRLVSYGLLDPSRQLARGHFEKRKERPVLWPCDR